MIIKKFVADNVSDALSMIKTELGKEAVIISRRNVKQKGLFGVFLPRRIEITAAVDDMTKKEPLLLDKVLETKKAYEKVEVEKELGEVKEMLKKLVDGKPKPARRERKSSLKRLLLESDVSEDVIDAITHEARSKDKYKSSTRLPDSAIIEQMQQKLKACQIHKGRVHAFIGPTGVGKTTTIAKIAGMHALNTNEKVGLITIDTYRIGAVEQLKIYADILGIPLEVVNSVSDIKRSMDNLKDCDTIFVDTTGRSTKNVMQLSELKLYLDRIKPDVTYLVVSMTTKYRDLLHILEGFSTINYNSIILTKLDETSTYGSVLNVAYNAKAPISYITKGQNVPDDIKEADAQELIGLILGEVTI
ncbi:MAG TPA: flagellar biosynthesis protein FlhF [Clostridiaceae bacterium]|nr:flagellar biosynthesis protein FlhF [Clostridiaceae bacterium]